MHINYLDIYKCCKFYKLNLFYKLYLLNFINFINKNIINIIKNKNTIYKHIIRVINILNYNS